MSICVVEPGQSRASCNVLLPTGVEPIASSGRTAAMAVVECRSSVPSSGRLPCDSRPGSKGGRPAAAAVVLLCLPSCPWGRVPTGTITIGILGHRPRIMGGVPKEERVSGGIPPKSGTAEWPRPARISQVRCPSYRRGVRPTVSGPEPRGFPGARSCEHLSIGWPKPTRVRAGTARGSLAHGTASWYWAKGAV